MPSPLEGGLRITVNLLNRYPCLQTPKWPLVRRAWAGLFQQYPQDSGDTLFSHINAMMWHSRELARAAGTVSGWSSLSGISLFFIELFFMYFSHSPRSPYSLNFMFFLFVSISFSTTKMKKKKKKRTVTRAVPRPRNSGPNTNTPRGVCLGVRFVWGFGGSFGGGSCFVGGGWFFLFCFCLTGWSLRSHISNDLFGDTHSVGAGAKLCVFACTFKLSAQKLCLPLYEKGQLKWHGMAFILIVFNWRRVLS